jgi:hypothetical protein
VSGGPAAVGHPPACPLAARRFATVGAFDTHVVYKAPPDVELARGRSPLAVRARGRPTPGAPPPTLLSLIALAARQAKRPRQTAHGRAAYLRTSSQFAFT